MTKRLDFTEVAVYADDGRSSEIGTFHGWQRRETDDGPTWWGHVMVYGPEGQYRDVVPAVRLVPLVYCGRLPTGEVRQFHRVPQRRGSSTGSPIAD